MVVSISRAWSLHLILSGDDSNGTLPAEQRNDVQRRLREKMDIERFRQRAVVSGVGAVDGEPLVEAVDLGGPPWKTDSPPLQGLTGAALAAGRREVHSVCANSGPRCCFVLP